MAFAIVELHSGLWMIVLKENIKNAEGYQKCLILNKHENVTLVGCHNNYILLNEMCIQHNANTMTVNLRRNNYSNFITPDQPIILINPVTPMKQKQCEGIERPKSICTRLFEIQGRPSETFQDVNMECSYFQICSHENNNMDINNINWLQDSQTATRNTVEDKISSSETEIVPPLIPITTFSRIYPPPLVPITSVGQAERKSRKTKQNYCKYCGQKRTCLSRHIISKHKDKPEVKDYISLSKSNPKKAIVLSNIRRTGNFQHGFQNSDFIPARIVKNVNTSKYVVCPYCQIILTKAALRRHVRIYCVNSNKNKQGRGTLKLSKYLQEKISNQACDILKEFIFPTFREGIVKETIRFDKLLIIYGNEMCAKYRSQHNYSMIRNRLILMTKLLMYMKNIDPLIQDFESILKPSHFNNIVVCINKFGQYNEETGVYLKPTLPTTIGTALKYILYLFKSECIKNGNRTGKQNCDDLLQLLTTSLPAHVNKVATESLLKLKRQKPVRLPSTEDIKNLNVYILSKRMAYLEKLESSGFEYKNWLELAKYTLISILIFNRRRPGELQRAQICDLENIQGIDKNNEYILKSLSKRDREAIDNYKRFTIRGKLARGVPVLLHKSMYKCIKRILHHRKEAGVHESNPYIFGLPQLNNVNKKIVYRHLIATDLIREFSKKCGASNPETLRATQLRKHIATKSISLNLKDNEISNLQSFLGHADKVHKEYYRQPVIVDDIVKMSKLLLIAQGDEVKSTLERSPILSIPPEQSSITKSHASSTVDTAQVLSLPETSTSQNMLPGPSKYLVPARKETSKVFSETECLQSSSDNEDGGDPDYLQVELTDTDSSDDERPRKRQLLDIDLGRIVRRTWNTPQKQTMRDIFKSHIACKQIPTPLECSDMIRQYPVLQCRTVPQMQMWVRNYVKKCNKNDFVRQTWNTPERHAVKKLFGKYIACTDGSAYPSVNNILKSVEHCPELQNRTPRKIRSQIQHQRNLFFK